MKSIWVLAAAALAGVVSTSASAQEPMRKECIGAVAPVARLGFDHDVHRLWYRRFWTGKCDGLTMLPPPFGNGCTESAPGWNEITGQMLAQAPAGREAEVAAKVCKLGELVGYEWAKDNDKRCIHTTGANSLGSLTPILREKGDVLARLDRVEAKAKGMCAALRAPVARR